MIELFDMYDVNRNPLGHTHPRGVPIKQGEYHIVVQVCVLDRQGRLLMTKRHPGKIDGNMWEVTAGSALAGEDSVTGAMRELREETGYSAENIIPLGKVNTSTAYSEEVIHLFAMTGLTPGEQQLDADEALEVEEYPFHEIYQIATSGQLMDVKTIAALAMVKEQLADKLPL